jgi:hypothetical protein
VSIADRLIEAACHCDAVRARVPARPEYQIDCICAIRCRNGARSRAAAGRAAGFFVHYANTRVAVGRDRAIMPTLALHNHILVTTPISNKFAARVNWALPEQFPNQEKAT